jgi:hypothetical protein
MHKAHVLGTEPSRCRAKSCIAAEKSSSVS